MNHQENILYSGNVTVHESITTENISVCIEVFNVCCFLSEIKLYHMDSFDAFQQAKIEKNSLSIEFQKEGKI